MRGAVAAGNPHTANAGARALAEGGNAVDAVVAAALAGFVVEGPLTGPAGGGFLLVREAGSEPTLLDGFFCVPSREPAAMEEVLIDFADASTQVFHIGEGSVAVPGLVAVLEEAHRRYGRLPWRLLAEPAAELARACVAYNEAQVFLVEILAPILERTEAGRRVYGRRDHVVTEEMAPALEAIAAAGARAVAELLPELADDIASYRVVERVPLATSFLGRRVVTNPPPSLGGAVIVAGLAELDRVGLGDQPGSGDAANRLAHALAAGYGGGAPTARLTGTTHVSVLDADGSAAALSSTLGSGSGVFRDGFQLNNMLGELDVIGHDEARGAGDRLPSMMAPTLVLDGAQPRLVVGSAGSVRLSGAILQAVASVTGYGLPVDEAIERPRLHVEAGSLHLEGGWPDSAAEQLAAAGWDVIRWSGRNLYFGGVAAVELRPDGTLAAAGDPRRGGYGVVVA
jgi:gamma-glutamyltranspeptidase/glutathione hydrolase